MFYALQYSKIPMRGFKVEHVIEDIQTLNQRALQEGEFRETPLLEVTAVSVHAYAYLSDKYAIMRSGASVGNKYGPMIVRKTQRAEGVGHRQKENFQPSALSPMLRGSRIAVPGKLTTAYLALQLLERDFIPVFIPFDEIFDAVEAGKADYGLIIHEGQLTYQQKGFEMLVDLGVWWHEKTGLPLPLGVDVIRRDLGQETMQEFAQLFRESIEYSLQHRSEALDYALQWGRGLEKKLGDQFVGMYVNEDTVQISQTSEEGLRRLLEEGYKKGLLPDSPRIEFV